ncbi:copper-binding protein [Vibrio sp. ZSDE26]|uniref:Copper-binding protein n=1 Tax=Vibrio amylolyticus TaxID=2847292 RepID=A0A9X2BNC2_9VIBR|nr:copper-binding protein [Vibrio amylolyticus]MCK6265778.1 copper-binding protein [Vibrio amylolyticus]
MKKSLIALSIALLSTTAFAEKMDHGSMDHGKMDHSKMDHASMDHGKMDHSKMDHSSMMNMEGMSAVGMPAIGAQPDKVVHVILSDDMKITFKGDVTIEPNDVVQFVVMNTGKIEHEFAIGSQEEQTEHRKMMATMDSHHDHDTGSAVTVAPGKAKQLLWHFHGDNNVEFACNIAGHYEAGMKKKIQL